MHLDGTSFRVGAEVAVAQHGHDRRVVEETHRVSRQFGDVYQRIGIGVTVDKCVGQEECSFLGVQDVHGAEMFVFGTDADYFLGHLDGVAVLSVEAGDESVRFARLHHHHAEVVALKHLVVGFFVSSAFAGTLLCQDAGIAFAAGSFVGVAQVDNLNAFQA